MPQIKVKKQFTRAKLSPSSFNKETRTIDVIFATTTPVLKYSWDGPFYEVLDMDGHIMDRAKGSLPILNDHQKYNGIKGIIGRAENIRKEGDVWIATLRFSKRKEVEDIISDVEDGILQDISFGYDVRSYEASPLAQGETVPTYIARQWETNEITLVVIPADPTAKVRSQDDESGFSEIEITETENNTNLNNNIMKREQIIAMLQKRGVSVPDGLTDDKLQDLLERSIATPPVNTPAAVTENNNDSVEATRRATSAERTRTKEITEAARGIMSEEFVTEHIDAGTHIAEVRKLVIAEVAKKSTENNQSQGANPSVTVGTEQREKVRTAMETALLHRVDPLVTLDVAAREFRGMDLMDMARFATEQGGVSTRGMSKREIAIASLNMDQSRGYHSSSDFPIILGNTVNRRLRSAYEEQSRTFMPFCRRVSAPDFKNITSAQLSNLVGSFDKINEGGEYKKATLTEGKETYKLAKYGKKIAITWEALINDDLNAFSRIPQAIAGQSAQLQSDIVYGILNDNAAMSDNVALFHATHKNLATTAAGVTAAAMAIARAAMRKQKGLEGNFINVAPKFLVVGPDKETEAQQLLNGTIMAVETAEVNVFKNSLTLIVDPRITDNRWFLIADPRSIDTIEYAFLEGENEVFTEQRLGFDIDGMEIKARTVFAAKAIDHRSMFKNAGA